MAESPAILFVADGRSPIARGWIGNLTEAGWTVHLASTFPCRPLPGLASMQVIQVALSGWRRRAAAASGGLGLAGRSWLRHWIGPLTVPLAARQLRAYMAKLEPDLVHALRVPFEGMTAAWANPPVPLIVSTWGNDLTLHAPSSPGMAWLTRRTLQRAAALVSDCQRDVRLAAEWGFAADQPTAVLPGNGGLDEAFFDTADSGKPQDRGLAELFQSLTDEQPLIVNPRGFRTYVRNDVFFECLPRVLQRVPDARVACPAMAGSPLAMQWLQELGLADHVSLLGQLEAEDMAQLMRRAAVSVSPSEHDGTPNSLLEAMASGALPVAGDLESVREWLSDGYNGLLVDPANAGELAQSILRGLSDDDLRRRAAEHNRTLVAARARRGPVQVQASAFYWQVAADG